MFPNESKPTHSIQKEGGVVYAFTRKTNDRNTTAI